MPRKKTTKNLIRKDLSYKGKGIAKTKKKAQRKTKVERTRNAGKWTEAMYWQRVRSALRNAFRWWGPAKLALDMASRPYTGTSKRIKREYQCAHCNQWFDRKDVEIDHSTECGSLSSYEDIAVFLQRLTPEDPNAFQVLCKDKCHKKKTKAYHENKKKAA